LQRLRINSGTDGKIGVIKRVLIHGCVESFAPVIDQPLHLFVAHNSHDLIRHVWSDFDATGNNLWDQNYQLLCFVRGERVARAKRARYESGDA
jgi:hypothetical protein